jgi:hypothetical protein
VANKGSALGLMSSVFFGPTIIIVIVTTTSSPRFAQNRLCPGKTRRGPQGGQLAGQILQRVRKAGDDRSAVSEGRRRRGVHMQPGGGQAFRRGTRRKARSDGKHNRLAPAPDGLGRAIEHSASPALYFPHNRIRHADAPKAPAETPRESRMRIRAIPVTVKRTNEHDATAHRAGRRSSR